MAIRTATAMAVATMPRVVLVSLGICSVTADPDVVLYVVNAASVFETVAYDEDVGVFEVVTVAYWAFGYLLGKAKSVGSPRIVKL